MRPPLGWLALDGWTAFQSTRRLMNEESSTVTAPPEKRSWLRKIYDWTLSWADRPEGPWALFIIALIESSIFPVPPDVLLIALCVGDRKKAIKFALICTAGSVVGGIIGYGIGFWGYEVIGKPIVDFYHGQPVMDKVELLYTEHGFLGILIAAITPIPYKVFTIASGLFHYNFGGFVLASIIGRGFRFFCVAGVIYYFGPAIKKQIEKYFDLFAWGFMILLILGFVALKFLKH